MVLFTGLTSSLSLAAISSIVDLLIKASFVILLCNLGIDSRAVVAIRNSKPSSGDWEEYLQAAATPASGKSQLSLKLNF